jgi:hypothetical protein
MMMGDDDELLPRTITSVANANRNRGTAEDTTKRARVWGLEEIKEWSLLRTQAQDSSVVSHALMRRRERYDDAMVPWWCQGRSAAFFRE